MNSEASVVVHPVPDPLRRRWILGALMMTMMLVVQRVGRRRDRRAAAPATLRAGLPHDISAVIGDLHGHALPAAEDHYLRLAIYTATHHVYLGLALVALLTLVVVLFTPRHFPAAGD